MPEIYFTADTHFFQESIIHRANRPFASFREMNEHMFDLWNETVKPEDTIYHLGDVTARFSEKELAQLRLLNGKKFLIPGNHDVQKIKNKLSSFFTIFPPLVDLPAVKVVMCHFPLESWNKRNYGYMHLHGHSHGNMRKIQARLDVGVDVHGFKPISLEECRAICMPKKEEGEEDVEVRD